MNQFIHFATNHWVLFLALIVVLVLLVLEEKRGSVKGVTKLKPQQAVMLINRESAVVVDVRDQESFKGGHLIDAINIASADLEKNINKLQKYKKKPVIVACKMGAAAIASGAILKKHGFEKVYSLDGGIAAWLKASLPVVKNS